MIPLILAVGLPAASVAAYLGLKSRCFVCASVFTWNENCLVCGRDVCGDCGVASPQVDYSDWPVSPKGRVCRNHEENLFENIKKLKSAIDRSEAVKVFSKNYKGKIPPLLLNQKIETQFHKNRDDADRELRIMAALLGASSVCGVELLREKREDGNYIYSEWKASGVV